MRARRKNGTVSAASYAEPFAGMNVLLHVSDLGFVYSQAAGTVPNFFGPVRQVGKKTGQPPSRFRIGCSAHGFGVRLRQSHFLLRCCNFYWVAGTLPLEGYRVNMNMERK